MTTNYGAIVSPNGHGYKYQIFALIARRSDCCTVNEIALMQSAYVSGQTGWEKMRGDRTKITAFEGVPSLHADIVLISRTFPILFHGDITKRGDNLRVASLCVCSGKSTRLCTVSPDRVFAYSLKLHM